MSADQVRETDEFSEARSTPKRFTNGTERLVDPAVTLERARGVMGRLGITRVATVTGLDRIGIPVIAVHRPNARSLSVAQGKGISLLAAQVSGLMESIESHHAEHVSAPLMLGSFHEMRARHRVVDVDGLARLSISCFHRDLSLLWVVGTDMFGGTPILVPYEVVHTDFRLPLPTGSGAFVMSSNGLASGNHMMEALSHAICELVERDANTLWHHTARASRASRRLDLATVDDGNCRVLLDRFEQADVDVVAWETTTDIGICSFLCTVANRNHFSASPLPPVSGSGCHPRRSIALLRALTEAAQGRLTIIAGARDDLSGQCFDAWRARSRGDCLRELITESGPGRCFGDAPDVIHETFDADVQWELERLALCGLQEVVAVNLTDPALAIPVVRVVVPYLETMSELRGYVPGRRARRVMQEADS